MESVDRRAQPGIAYPDEGLRQLATELSARFAGVFNPETVERYVLESYASLLRVAVVRNHLVNLTSRFAKERLTALAQAKGALDKTRPEVLFVCEHNAGRSQLAAALTASISGGAVHVRSAGSLPRASVDPAVLAAAEELGLDLSAEFPKPLTDDVVQAADVVITMGCGDACPVYPGKRYVDWELDDPAGQPVEVVRVIRDDIQRRVEQLLSELIPEKSGA